MNLRNWALRRASMLMARRSPDMTISCAHGVYMRRWHVIPRNRLLNVYVHEFLGPDPGEHLHDHPWWSLSWVLSGSYVEVVGPVNCIEIVSHENSETVIQTVSKMREIAEGMIVFRRATSQHKVVHVSSRVTHRNITVFITGPVIRKWGFWVRGKFVPHDAYEPGEGVRVEDTADRGA